MSRSAELVANLGYKYKERILRPARVAVTEPEAAPAPEAVAEPVGE